MIIIILIHIIIQSFITIKVNLILELTMIIITFIIIIKMQLVSQVYFQNVRFFIYRLILLSVHFQIFKHLIYSFVQTLPLH